MHVVFESARRWPLIGANPIELVRQRSRRTKVPRIITPEQFQKLLDELEEPYQTMVLIAGCLGLRASEVMGLQWQDIDWDKLEIMLERGSVHGRLDKLKTESSKKSVPMDSEVAIVLLNHRGRSVVVEPADFILPSPVNEGKPRWQETVLEDYVKPAGFKAGIRKVGWHTFRHTYRAMLKRRGTPLEVQKELMRHSHLKTTLGYGVEMGVAPENRLANSQVVKLLLGRK